MGINVETTKKQEIKLRETVERTLSKMPDGFDDWVRTKICFVFPQDNENARTINRKESKKFDGIIILHNKLLEEEETEQERIILHEIAHVKLGHVKQKDDPEKEVRQEKEADDLALYWKHSKLIERHSGKRYF